MTADAHDPSAPADADPDRTLVARDAAAQSRGPAASSNVLPEGTQLGEFSVTGVIGEGGFGIVYRAHDRALQRTVAVKEYMPSALAARLADTRVVVKSEQHRETFEVGLRSFINEARLLAQFDHPALVKVFRFWAANGTAYMAMPLYEGGTLKQTLKAMAAPPDEAWLRKLLVPLLDAIELLHAADCLHRDIAPDNILMGPGSTPETPRPVLLDFGAARRVIGGQTQALTVILKPGYAPIEQYDEIPGMKQGPWTDLYALGAVMHFAITGKPPPPSVGRLVHDAWVPLSTVAAGRYSAGFLAAIDAVLAARPEARPRSVAQWRALLADATHPAAGPLEAGGAAPAEAGPKTHALSAAPTTESPMLAASARSPRWGRAVAVGAAVAAVIVGSVWGVLAWQMRQAEQRLAAAPQPAPASAKPGSAASAVAAPAADPAPGPSAAPAPPAAASAEPHPPRPAPAAAAPAASHASAPLATPPDADAQKPPAVERRPRPAAPVPAAVAASAGTPPVPPEATGTPLAPTPVAAPAGWIEAALQEGRVCLAARQYACTIARAESVLKAEPAHPAAQALLKDGRAAQEAALAGDWKMR
jgi:tRNA A-37 threonylcarbamoyl transferase component Bud32